MAAVGQRAPSTDCIALQSASTGRGRFLPFVAVPSTMHPARSILAETSILIALDALSVPRTQNFELDGDAAVPGTKGFAGAVRTSVRRLAHRVPPVPGAAGCR